MFQSVCGKKMPLIAFLLSIMTLSVFVKFSGGLCLCIKANIFLKYLGVWIQNDWCFEKMWCWMLPQLKEGLTNFIAFEDWQQMCCWRFWWSKMLFRHFTVFEVLVQLVAFQIKDDVEYRDFRNWTVISVCFFNLLQRFVGSKLFVGRKLIHYFIYFIQGHIKLIKIYCKHIYNVTNDFCFK